MIVCIAKVVRSALKEVVTAVLWMGFILAMTSASAAEDSQDRKPSSHTLTGGGKDLSQKH